MNDLISRQAAIDALHMHLMYRMGTDSNKKRLDEWINNLPSTQPGRKRGQWLDGYKRQTCSLCKGKGVKSWNYCPYCGADMRKVDDERPD